MSKQKAKNMLAGAASTHTGSQSVIKFDPDNWSDGYTGDYVPPAGGKWPASAQSYGGGKTIAHAPSCYESHKPMPLGNGWEIHGGNCGSPTIKDADVYIGFQSGMKFTAKAWPWTQGFEVPYPIPDGTAPKAPKNFRALVDWTVEQIKGGAKVHAGCIGGHGRTGLFFAALVAVMMPEEKDPIAYVRKNYCASAIETSEQIEFLVKHYGCKKAKARYADLGTWSGKGASKGGGAWPAGASAGSGKSVGATDEVETGAPLATAASVWGRNVAG